MIPFGIKNFWKLTKGYIYVPIKVFRLIYYFIFFRLANKRTNVLMFAYEYIPKVGLFLYI